jgi:hypothetical protein
LYRNAPVPRLSEGFPITKGMQLLRVVEQAALGATLLLPQPWPPHEGRLPYPLGSLTFLASPANSLLLNSPSYQQKAMSCVGRKPDSLS